MEVISLQKAVIKKIEEVTATSNIKSNAKLKGTWKNQSNMKPKDHSFSVIKPRDMETSDLAIKN